MSDSSASLWSPQIRADILSPKQILTRQAVALATQTKDVLTGVLTESRTEDETTVFTLNIVAPILKYRHQVLTASYNGSKLYPTQVDAEVLRRKGQSEIEVRVALGNVALGGGRKPLGRADDDEELIRIVGYVLKSSEVVSVAQSLIARSNEALIPLHFVRYLKTLSEAERDVAIEEKITATNHEILDSLEFANTIAMTNAYGWGMDECRIEEVDMSDEECTVSLSYSASGDQDKEKPYSGDTVVGTAVAVIDSQGNVQYSEITADVAHDPDESGSSDASGTP